MTEASSTEKKQQMAGKMRVRKHHSCGVNHERLKPEPVAVQTRWGNNEPDSWHFAVFCNEFNLYKLGFTKICSPKKKKKRCHIPLLTPIKIQIQVLRHVPLDYRFLST